MGDPGPQSPRDGAASKTAAEMRTIQASEFARRLRAATKPVDEQSAGLAERQPEARFAFFLGAGCSRSSGIPSAGELVRDYWLPRLRDMKAPKRRDLESWAREFIPDYDPANPALSYGKVMDALFFTPEDRQKEIEAQCDGRSPGFGYAVLAQLIKQYKGQFNIVLTTNFDDLMADALYLYTDARPLVIPHESLAGFIRPTRTRPLIIKLHGDHRLTPRNTALETRELKLAVIERTAMVLHDRGLIFMGYGGNDLSIHKLLSGLSSEALPLGVYWVSTTEPTGPILECLRRHHLVWVRAGYFDEVMLLIHNEFKLPHPSQQRFNDIFANYQKAFRGLSGNIDAKPAEDAEAAKLRQAVDETTESLPDCWQAMTNAQRYQRSDPDKADEIYRQAVEKFADVPALLGSYADFLFTIRKEYDHAEQCYLQAIKGEPKNAVTLGNYAVFLKQVRSDLDGAQKYLERSIDADPKNVINLSNYANFFADHGAYERAENVYRQALSVDPKSTLVLCNYAGLLLALGRRHEGADLLNQAISELTPDTDYDEQAACWFYVFAHRVPTQRADALAELKLLIVQEQARAQFWNVSANVKSAIADGHPDAEWLPKLAAVINDKAPPETLDEWPAWAAIELE